MYIAISTYEATHTWMKTDGYSRLLVSPSSIARTTIPWFHHPRLNAARKNRNSRACCLLDKGLCGVTCFHRHHRYPYTPYLNMSIWYVGWCTMRRWAWLINNSSRRRKETSLFPHAPIRSSVFAGRHRQATELIWSGLVSLSAWIHGCIWSDLIMACDFRGLRCPRTVRQHRSGSAEQGVRELSGNSFFFFYLFYFLNWRASNSRDEWAVYSISCPFMIVELRVGWMGR